MCYWQDYKAAGHVVMSSDNVSAKVSRVSIPQSDIGQLPNTCSHTVIVQNEYPISSINTNHLNMNSRTEVYPSPLQVIDTDSFFGKM